jgi:aminoglycoside phosphotransferase (APT) family kinase protein
MSGGALSSAELAGVTRTLAEAGEEVVGALTSERIAGGRSNVTLRLADDAGHQWVLRSPPRAGRTPSAHDVGREHRITRALGATAVPVPRAVAFRSDDTVFGLPYAIAAFVPGRTVQTRAQLADLDDATCATVVERLVTVLADLHDVDPVGVGLGDLGRPTGYAERQVRRWTDQWQHVAIPAVGALAQEVARELGAGVPPQQRSAIVHGDFRLDNAILTDTARVGAVVDWELSTLGDPVADVALMAVYRDPALDLVLGLDAAWASERLPGPGALAAAYERASGTRLRYWEFHCALAAFKLAVIAAGIDHRHRAGATTDPQFASAGRAVEPLLELAAIHLRLHRQAPLLAVNAHWGRTDRRPTEGRSEHLSEGQPDLPVRRGTSHT